MRAAVGFIGLLRPHRLRLCGGVVCLMLLAATGAGYAFLTGPVLQVVLTGGRQGTGLIPIPAAWTQGPAVLLLVALLIGGLALIKGLANLGQAVLLEGTAEEIGHRLRVCTFDHLVRLPLAWHRRRGLGDLLARLLDDVQHVQEAAVSAPITLVREGLGALALLVVALWMSASLTLAAAVALPLAGLVIGLLSRAVKAAARRRQGQLGALADRAAVALGAIREVKSSQSEQREVEALAGHGRRALAWARRRIVIRAAAPLANEVMAAAALGVTLVFAGKQIAAGTLMPERFVSFFAALLMIYRPVKSMGLAVHQMASGRASVERMEQLLDQPAEQAGGEALPRLSRGLRLVDISFRYGSDGPEALAGVDLELPIGEVVALAGPSGAGKSTLASIACGLERPSHGRLYWDDMEITSRPLADLRLQVALVPQQPLVLPASLAENLRYGAPQAQDDDLARILEAVGLEGVPARHAQGLEVRLGPPDGLGLSVGEAQRLAVARALLRRVRLVVLDEPSSALDGESEQRLVRLLDELRRSHAVLVVAHSAALIGVADRVIYLEGGRMQDDKHRTSSAGIRKCQDG